MPYDFDAGRPIYQQLSELMIHSIVSGEFTPGQRLPGVRELALQYGVNPNTAQRTMAELERKGLVYSERTAGRFVTTDKELIADMRKATALEQAVLFLKNMMNLGIAQDEVQNLLADAAAELKKGENDE